MYTYVRTYVHTYIHTYIHACMHTYTHICSLPRSYVCPPSGADARLPREPARAANAAARRLGKGQNGVSTNGGSANK